MDNAGATPVSDTALKAMAVTMKKFPANPSAIHKEGREARACLEQARVEIATAMTAHADEIVFTSGATEANNLAILGVIGAAFKNGARNPHVIVSTIEHPSVLEVVNTLKGENVMVDYLPVDSRGLVNPRELRKLITPETVLVSVMYANNEIGTIEPIHDIAKEIRHARKVNGSVYPYFHTDAVQAVNYLDIGVHRLGVDLMTLSSGKVYGPRGIGALFAKRGVKLIPIMYGGEHEGGRRPGTESPALAVGFASALLEARKMNEKESKRVGKLRDMLAEKILKKITGTSVNGSLEHSLPNILSMSFEGIESDALVLYLDAVGIAVSGKSSCKSSDVGQSHVIIAVCGSVESGVIRFSLGQETKQEDVTRVVSELSHIVPLLRMARSQSDSV